MRANGTLGENPAGYDDIVYKGEGGQIGLREGDHGLTIDPMGFDYPFNRIHFIK